MDLANLEGETLAIEIDQEAIQEVKSSFWPALPQEHRREPCLADDVIELATPDVDMQRGTVHDVPPLASTPMRLDVEGLAVESPAR
jgi:hypothetical protein